MTTDQIDDAVAQADGSALAFHLATGQRVLAANREDVLIHRDDVMILHRKAPDSNHLRGYDLFDAASVLRVEIADADAALLESTEPSPLLTPGVAALAWGESLLSVLACGVICARVGKLGFDYYISSSSITASDAWLVGWWSILITIEVAVLLSILRFYQHRIYPLPLHYALGYRMPGTRLTSGAMGLFWLGHAVLGVWSFSQLSHLFSDVSGLWDGPMQLLIQVLDVLFVFAGAHASMLFLLLAAKSFGSSQDGLRRLWRWRMLIDLLIVLISFGLIYQQTLSKWIYPQKSRRRYGY